MQSGLRQWSLPSMSTHLRSADDVRRDVDGNLYFTSSGVILSGVHLSRYCTFSSDSTRRVHTLYHVLPWLHATETITYYMSLQMNNVLTSWFQTGCVSKCTFAPTKRDAITHQVGVTIAREIKDDSHQSDDWVAAKFFKGEVGLPRGEDIWRVSYLFFFQRNSRVSQIHIRAFPWQVARHFPSPWPCLRLLKLFLHPWGHPRHWMVCKIYCYHFGFNTYTTPCFASTAACQFGLISRNSFSQLGRGNKEG